MTEALQEVYTDEPVEEVVEEQHTEETQESLVEESVQEEVETEETQQYTEAEQVALSKGWKPDGVEGKRTLSAEEFNDRESFFERIHKLEKQNNSLRSTVDEMASQHTKIAELERVKVLDELKARKKVALAEENYDEVIELDDKIAETRDIPVEEVKTGSSEEAPVDPNFSSWQSQNTWYETIKNPDVFAEANALGESYVQRTGKAGTDMYNYVANTMKRLYPDVVGGVVPRRPASVEGNVAPTQRRRAGPKKHTKKDLNDNQRRVMNTYVRRGVMTEDEYISELAKIGELG